MRRRPGGPGAGGGLQSPGCVRRVEAAGWGSAAPDRSGSWSSAPFGPRAPRRAGIGFVVLGLLGPGDRVCHLAWIWSKIPGYRTLPESWFSQQNGNFWPGQLLGPHPTLGVRSSTILTLSQCLSSCVKDCSQFTEEIFWAGRSEYIFERRPAKGSEARSSRLTSSTDSLSDLAQVRYPLCATVYVSVKRRCWMLMIPLLALKSGSQLPFKESYLRDRPEKHLFPAFCVARMTYQRCLPCFFPGAKSAKGNWHFVRFLCFLCSGKLCPEDFVLETYTSSVKHANVKHRKPLFFILKLLLNCWITFLFLDWRFLIWQTNKLD